MSLIGRHYTRNKEKYNARREYPDTSSILVVYNLITPKPPIHDEPYTKLQPTEDYDGFVSYEPRNPLSNNSLKIFF